MATAPTPVVGGGRAALAPDFSQLRLGDILALVGAALYFLAKFLPFFVITITGVQPITSAANGWNGSRDLLNILEILAVVAVIGAFVVGPLLALVPQIRSSIGLIYGGCGAVLLLLTLIAFLDVRNSVQQAQFLTGGPGFGFFLGLLFALVVGLAGLVKMRIIPGDGRVALASPPEAPAQMGGQPFASGPDAPDAQPPQFVQGGRYAVPPNGPGSAPGYSAPPTYRGEGGPPALGRPAPPPATPGSYAPPSADRRAEPGVPPPGGQSGPPPSHASLPGVGEGGASPR